MTPNFRHFSSKLEEFYWDTLYSPFIFSLLLQGLSFSHKGTFAEDDAKKNRKRKCKQKPNVFRHFFRMSPFPCPEVNAEVGNPAWTAISRDRAKVTAWRFSQVSTKLR